MLSISAARWKIALVVTVVITAFCICTNAQLTSPGAYSRFEPGGQYIMFTFSGGPHHSVTPRILDILKEKKVKATFFVAGLKALHNEHLLERMAQDGHEVGNHGFFPYLFSKMADEKILASIHRTSELIKNATHVNNVKYIRPPSGNTNPDVNQLLKHNGDHKVILWSLDAKDQHFRSVRDIKRHVTTKARPGDVALFHDNANMTVKALPIIIDDLYEKGYEFLTLSQIFSFPDDSPH
eukprot:CAMPEP_0174961478 /NCGR_PEP_ID=MMETSP0004_2-20121128/4260_1 /TAXON_ID=420556 /ORGANISM="Ochromonas sp., Strain CCMP1393" /LENGTH=237 /DNA_ID=CAMNT_0016209923 /DNA_START=161 /DNA_END=874 /DNA_ORIENTATION=+